MTLDLLHNKIIKETLTEGFERSVSNNLVPKLYTLYGASLEGIQLYEDYINDDFIKLYFEYQEHAKVVSSFGQGHLDAINPKTGRIHTVYRQLGAASGRMSCGSQQANTDLAKAKQLPAKRCTSPNLQQLPSDEATRSSFVSEKGNLFCSCDYSAKLKIPINVN